MYNYQEISRNNPVFLTLIWFWIDDNNGRTYGANTDNAYLIEND